MTCVKPYTNEYGQQFPCGHCIMCRNQKAREWAVRCLHEADYWESSTFLTLTYRDESLPANQSLDKEELQKFFKRLRKQLSKQNRKIKHFSCGEYGEDKGRPHYHSIVFGVNAETDREIIEEAWGHGLIDISIVCYETCQYVGGYMSKDDPWKDYGKREKPFRLVSNGFGLRHIENKANNQQYCENLYMKARGVKMALPKYYKDKLGLDGSLYIEKALQKKEIERREHPNYDQTELAILRFQQRRQKAANKKAQLELKQRNKVG